MPLMTKKREKEAARKQVACTHCDGMLEVGQRAMSVFCPHCKKRLILEDFKITSYHGVREFATCGDVVIEKRGHVSAVVKVMNLTVKGKLQGNVRARGAVVLHKTARCQGDIETSSLRIDSGATINGFVRVSPTLDPFA